MKQTALYNQHKDLNAKFIPFSGWDMPVQYTGIKDEVLSVRKHVGIFDVSHMGEFIVEGKETYKFIDHIVTNDVGAAAMNKAIYSPLCREDGTTIDDLIVYKLTEERALICVNAANIEKDWEWINSHVNKFDCTLTNQSDNYSLIAVQGPKTLETLKSIGMNSEILDMEYYSCIESDDMIVARTGYTGEDGVEIFCSNEKAREIWDTLIACDAKPCGLAARDVLRLEVCYPLYGNELTNETTPLDAALKWTIKFNKEQFIGKEALMNYKPKYRLVKLALENGIPRSHYQVQDSQNNIIGEVTSGTISVVTGRGIALARIEVNKYPKDGMFYISIRNKNYDASLQKKAFVTGGHK